MFPKRGAIALVTTALALVLLFNFKTPDATAVAGVKTDPGTGTAVGSATATATTVTGSLIATRYGNVEVQVTVAAGKITNVTAVELPSGGRSGEISSYVAPLLASEALSAQSAKIDIVSGATYTSQAYARSLQAALDQAGVASSTVSG